MPTRIYHTNGVWDVPLPDPPVRVPNSSAHSINAWLGRQVALHYQASPTVLYRHTEGKWAKQIAQRGAIRLNTLTYYRGLEQTLGDQTRGDSEEGLTQRFRPFSASVQNHLQRTSGDSWAAQYALSHPSASFTNPGKDGTHVEMWGCAVRHSRDVADRCLVFCLSTNSDPTIGKRISQQNDSVVAISNSPRLWMELGLAVSDSVDLVPVALMASRTFTGPRTTVGHGAGPSGPFPALLKPGQYAWQEEFRFVALFSEPLKQAHVDVGCRALARAVLNAGSL